MHIWLFSSGGILNEDIDISLMNLFKNDEPKISFIPSSFDSSAYYYDEFVERFGRFGFHDIDLFHADQAFTKKDLENLLSSDMIYLSGGNTFYFLAVCRKTGLLNQFEKFVKKGGILAGHSAGAILLTPSITTASYPEDDRDDNDVGLKNLSAAGLVNFEVFPHYDHSNYYEKTLKRASIESDGPIYGVADGAAIAVNDGFITFYGEIWGFINGECFQISGHTISKKLSRD